MPVANSNRKLLDLKRWTVMPTPAPAATQTGSLIISSRLNQQRQLYIINTATAWLYYPFEDGWVQIPSPALAGTFGAGSCGTCSAVGPTGTATGGSATTINTGLNLQRGLNGYQVQITAGPGAGEIRTIARNTLGANATITVTSAFSTAITASSTFRLLTPRWYVLSAGTLAVGSFRMYCFALNTWTTLANTGLPATWGGDGKMIATPSFVDNGVDLNFATGTATTSTSTTLADTDSGKNWAVNQWANFQVHIVSGAGAGQIRTIASNTSNTLTVASAWTVTPDATSVYHIEGNDDFLYILGNSAVTLYRYSISGNTTTTLAPVAARASNPGPGASGHWVFDVPASIDASWSDENAIINGRRIYSFRGNGGATLDYYDIAANTWVSGVVYAPQVEAFSSGSKYIYASGYIYMTRDATGRWFRFSPAEGSMGGFTANIYPQGGAVVGDTAFDTVEPETGVRFLNMVLNSSNIHMRCMVI